MVIELELAALVALQVVSEVRSRRHRRDLAKLLEAKRSAAPAAAAPAAAAPAPPTEHVEIIKRHGAGWVRVGHRHAEHPDVREALVTPGLAVRHPDGRIEGGSN
jgi:soluble lytic murein transglycosylase-like protein